MPKNKNVLMNVEGVDFYINDELFKHFKSLPKMQQEAVKQMMILGMLNNKSLFCSCSCFFSVSFGCDNITYIYTLAF